MPPIDDFADGLSDAETAESTAINEATQQSQGHEIMPSDQQATGPGDDYSAGEPQQPQYQPDDNSGLSELQHEAQQVYGFSAEDMSGLSDGQLQQMLGAMDRRFTSQWQQQQPVDQQQQPQDPEDEYLFGEEGQGPEQPEYQGFSPEQLNYEWGDEHGFEPEVVELFDKVAEHSNSQLQGAAQSIQQIESVLADMLYERDMQSQTEYANKMDGFFDGLTGPLQQMYGAGEASQMNQNSQEFVNRMAFNNDVNAFMQAEIQQGRQPDMDHILQRVLRSRHSSELDAITRHGVRSQANSRRQQAIRRPNVPTGARGVAAEERAGSCADDWYRSRGMEPTPSYGGRGVDI